MKTTRIKCLDLVLDGVAPATAKEAIRLLPRALSEGVNRASGNAAVQPLEDAGDAHALARHIAGRVLGEVASHCKGRTPPVKGRHR